MDDGGVNAAVADSAYRAARDAINGSDPSGGALYYYNPAKATSQWIFSRPIITVIAKQQPKYAGRIKVILVGEELGY